jgi:hypothetical protein
MTEQVDKKKYILEAAKILSADKLLILGSILVNREYELSEHLDGCRIIIDKIDDNTINELYSYIKNTKAKKQ